MIHIKLSASTPKKLYVSCAGDTGLLNCGGGCKFEISCKKQHNFSQLLPPAYEVRGKVMFSQVSVHISGDGGGGDPIPGPDDSIQLTGEYPIPGLGKGVPHPRWGVSHPANQGHLIQLIGGSTPSQVQVGGYPIQPTGGEPPPIQDWMGYPPPIHDWYPLHPRMMGYLPPIQDWMGYPPPSRQETEQHSEHLLRGGRYASCVHAGGLFCISS